MTGRRICSCCLHEIVGKKGIPLGGQPPQWIHYDCNMFVETRVALANIMATDQDRANERNKVIEEIEKLFAEMKEKTPKKEKLTPNGFCHICGKDISKRRKDCIYCVVCSYEKGMLAVNNSQKRFGYNQAIKEFSTKLNQLKGEK